MTADTRLPAQIAIDGPAASGKTTIGLALAARFGYQFLDTGLMYRAFTLAALRAAVAAREEAVRPLLSALKMRVEANSETRIYLGDEDVTGHLRDADVEANVSAYSALPAVREAMVRQQREVAARAPSVLVGRDIGTVVLPGAPLKFYLEASEAVRAVRRSAQSGGWGTARPQAAARGDIAGRDAIDSTRAASPLKPAPDAIVIDTTEMTLEAVIAAVVGGIECAES